LGLADYPHGGVGDDDGSRSTPVVDGDRVFVMTSYLRLACLDGASGEIVWSRDLTVEFGGVIIPWQNAASPLVEGELVIVNSNGRPGEHLLAFRKAGGELAWKGHSDGLTHATPVAATIGGVRQVVFLAQSGLVSVAPLSGRVLWRHPLNYNSTSVAASPVVAGDLVYASRGYPGSLSRAQAGAVVLSVGTSGGDQSVAPVWTKVNQLMNHWNTPVHLDGYLYGMFGQSLLSLKCVEVATGEEKWSVDGFGYGSIAAANGRVLASSENGWLVVVDPSPEAYKEIARVRPLRGKTWNIPAIADGRIYFRSTTEAVCLDVSLPLPTALSLTRVERREGGKFRFIVGTSDNAALNPDRALRIDVLATADINTPPVEWAKAGALRRLEDGNFGFEDEESGGLPQRFYRLEEHP